MKDKTKGSAGANKTRKSELNFLLTLARKVAALRDEFDRLTISPVCDGAYADDFSNAFNRLNEVLVVDLANPMHACVLEEMVNSNPIAV